MEVTAIYRAPVYCPGRHVENDRLILELAVARLQRRGVDVVFMEEDEVGRRALAGEAVISMCRGPRANRVLAEEVRRGRLVTNSPLSVSRCYRENLYRALAHLEREDAAGGAWPWPSAGRGPGGTVGIGGRGVPARVAARPGGAGDATGGLVAAPHIFPPTIVVDTADPDIAAAPWVEDGPVWVKNGHVHAVGPDDVRLAREPGAWRELVRRLARRGAGSAIVQRHIDGVVVKFYGVVGGRFFRHYCEADAAISPLALGAAQPRIEALMAALGLEIYGGDVVIDRRGRIFLIDVNDWPSFASFRRAAAQAIAGHLFRRFTRHARASRAARSR